MRYRNVLVFLGWLLYSSTLLWAQSLEILEPVPAVITGATDASQLEFHLSVQNKSTQTLNVRAAIEILEAEENHLIYFCWTNCYAPGVLESPDVETIAPGEINKKFVIYLRPNGTEGTSKVRATFFVDGNPDDKVSAIAEFQVGTIAGFADHLPKTVQVHPIYLNEMFIQWKYRIPFHFQTASLKILNILGKTIRTYSLQSNSGNVLLDRSLLPSGMYFYSLIVDGKPYYTGSLVLP